MTKEQQAPPLAEWTTAEVQEHNPSMPTPMSTYAEIAARHHVDPHDEDAVTRFFRETAPTLSSEERMRIAQELLAGQEDEERAPKRQRYTRGTPDVRPHEPKLAAVPPRAFNPHRDGDELDAIARSLIRWLDHYFRLSGMDIVSRMTIGETGQLRVDFEGAGALQLAAKEQQSLLDSIRSLLSHIAAVQPVLDIIEIGVSSPASNRAPALGARQVVPGTDENRRVVSMDHVSVKAMSVEDAAQTLAQSPDQFIVFRDAEDDKVRVIYKRSDRNLGLISAD